MGEFLLCSSAFLITVLRFGKRGEDLVTSALTGPVLLGHFVEEAGRIGLDLPFYSSGLPRPPQLHGAQQAEGLCSRLASECLRTNSGSNSPSNYVPESRSLPFPPLSTFFPLRSVKQRSKVFAPFSEEVTSCLPTTRQATTRLPRPQRSSASKKWSVQEVRRRGRQPRHPHRIIVSV